MFENYWIEKYERASLRLWSFILKRHTCLQGEPPVARQLNRPLLLKHHFILFSYSLNYNQTEMRTEPFQRSFQNMNENVLRVCYKRKALPFADILTTEKWDRVSVLENGTNPLPYITIYIIQSECNTLCSTSFLLTSLLSSSVSDEE